MSASTGTADPPLAIVLGHLAGDALDDAQAALTTERAREIQRLYSLEDASPAGYPDHRLAGDVVARALCRLLLDTEPARLFELGANDQARRAASTDM